MNAIAFFDVDETLFTTFAKIIIKDKDTGKELKQLTNKEFNSYKLKDNEEFDFSQFTNAKMFDKSKIIKVTLKRVKEEYANSDTMIVFLTARASFDSNKEFISTFQKYGIRVGDKRVRFELAGNLKRGTIPQKKEYVINKFIKRFKPETVKIFDDHIDNVNIVNTLAKKYDEITFEKYLIKNNSIVTKGKLNEMIGSFKEFVSEARDTSKNTHMTHIEDLVLYGGVKGAREAIFALRAMRDMLSGHTASASDLSVKWDGAPAIFVGRDPSDNRFFIAKKGIFGKNPKVYKSEEEIDADTSGDLAQKLKVAFNELKDAGIVNIIQGDLMFTKGDVKKETIDGEKYYTFQPNTIVYAVPVNSNIGKKIGKAKMGVVFHTSYDGPSFEKLQASFKVDLSSIKQKSSVWMTDASYQDLSGTVTFTDSDRKIVTAALSKAGKIFQKISGTTLKEIEKDQALAQKLEQFNNTLTRRGERITNTKKHVDNLIAWFDERLEMEIGKRKTEKGKEPWIKKKEEMKKFFSPANKKNLDLIYQLQNAIVDAKLLIIKKLDQVKHTSTFVLTKNGFKVTGPEGYVAIDHATNGAVKLVDRMEFSYNNFSADVIKGWDR
jgi:hypothetical protein